MTPEQKYEALRARIATWAKDAYPEVEAATEFGLGVEYGQKLVAEGLLEFIRGMEEA